MQRDIQQKVITAAQHIVNGTFKRSELKGCKISDKEAMILIAAIEENKKFVHDTRRIDIDLSMHNLSFATICHIVDCNVRNRFRSQINFNGYEALAQIYHCFSTIIRHDLNYTIAYVVSACSLIGLAATLTFAAGVSPIALAVTSAVMLCPAITLAIMSSYVELASHNVDLVDLGVVAKTQSPNSPSPQIAH